MSDDIKGIPYSTVEFDKEGQVLKEPDVPADTAELIVVSHGWNNDREAAETLYRRLFENFAQVTAQDAVIKASKMAIVGIIWPSKKFDEFMTEPTEANLRLGGAAAAGGQTDKASSEKAMHEAINRVVPLFDDANAAGIIAALQKLVPQLESDTDKQREFVETLRKLVEPDGTLNSQHSSNDGSDMFFEDSAAAVFERAVQEPVASIAVTDDNAPTDTGHAAGIGDLFSGVASAVQSLLNMTTYYEMKKRAGTVGTNGVAPLLDKLSAQLTDLRRIHLVGHSFGGRVVTAAATNSTTDKLYSLSLLQAAFSQNAFSKKRSGFFRSMVENKRIKGPVLVTHTRNDTAVGRAYAIASRISGDNASGVGGPDDIFGGLGSNGAQQMDAVEIANGVNKLLATDQPYTWQAGKFHNLESSDFIIDPKGGDAHGFVYVPQVAWAISRVIAS